MLSFTNDSSSALLNRLDLILGSFYSLIFPRFMRVWVSECVCVCVSSTHHTFCAYQCLVVIFQSLTIFYENCTFYLSARIKKRIDICIGIEKSVSSTISLIEILVVYKMYKKIDLFHTLRHCFLFPLLTLFHGFAFCSFSLSLIFTLPICHRQNRQDFLLGVMLIIFK